MCIARTHTHTLRFFYHKQIYAFPSFSYFFIHSFIDAVGRLPIGCWISRRLLPLCIYRIVDAFSFVFINFDLSISGCVARIMCVMYAFVVYIYIYNNTSENIFTFSTNIPIHVAFVLHLCAYVVWSINVRQRTRRQ